MDPWRRKLDRINRLRRPPRVANATIKKCGQAALALGGCLAVWFLLLDRTHSLDPSPAPETGATLNAEAADHPATSVADGFALYSEQKFAEALPLLIPLADAGSGRAQCMAGKILAQGLGGTASDKVEGTKWLDLCTRTPDGSVDGEAGDLLRHLTETVGWEIVGEGKWRGFQWQQAKINTERNEPGSASELVLRELGSMDGVAAFALGVKLNEGDDSPVDYEKALRCFQRAAERGLVEAHFNVGIAYYAGKGVKADPHVALRAFKVAAEGGFAKAATMVGIMAARGDGMAPDTNMALAYLKMGADLGDPDAGLIREAVAAGAALQ